MVGWGSFPVATGFRGTNVIKLLRGFKNDKSGASAAEYALMVALVGGAIILTATSLGTSIKGVFTTMGTAVTASGTNIGK